MSKSVHSARQKALAEMVSQHRKAAGLTQATVAKAMGRHQPFIANIESGDRRIDLIELMELADIIAIDVHAVVENLKKVRR